MNKYRIIRTDEYDKHGFNKGSIFRIQRKFILFGFEFWIYVIDKTTNILFEPITPKIYFTTLHLAQDFIETVLVQNKPYNTSTNEIIES